MMTSISQVPATYGVIALIVLAFKVPDFSHNIRCRRCAKLDPWQRRALMDKQSRGFEVISREQFK